MFSASTAAPHRPSAAAGRSAKTPSAPDQLPDYAGTEPTWYLHRPRLDVLLERLLGEGARILGIWGAAGSGKTTLMAGWARRLRADGPRVMWVSVRDLADADGPADLAGRLLSAAAALRPDAPDAPDGPDASDAGVALVVFVDDLHLLAPAQLDGLVTHLGAAGHDLRFVLSGRYRPFAETAPLEAAGVVLECLDPMLAFSPAEINRLAAHRGIDLAPEDCASLWRHTGGWATGLALALTWRATDRDSQGIRRFNGDNRAVADYLAAEVVVGLDDDERDLLMCSAVSELVPLELSVVLTGRTDAGEVLARTARRTTLIGREPDASGRNVYRYHPILLAYLQGEARRRDTSGTRARHLRACRWYADRANGAAALDQSLLVGDAAVIADLLDRFGLELALTGATDLVGRALRRLQGVWMSTATLALRLLLDAPYFPAKRRAHQLLLAADAVITGNSPAGAGGSATVPVFTGPILTGPILTGPIPTADDLGEPDVLSAGSDSAGSDSAGSDAAGSESVGSESVEPPAAGAWTADRWSAVVAILHALAATEQSDIQVRLTDLTGSGEAARSRVDPAVDLLAATAEGRCLDELGHPDRAETTLRDAAESARAAGYDWLFLLASDLAATAAAHHGDWRHVAMLEDQMALTARTEPWATDVAAGRAMLYGLVRRYEGCEPVDRDILDALAVSTGTWVDPGVTVPARALQLLVQLDDSSRPRQSLDRLTLLMQELGPEHPRALSLCCVPLVALSGALDGRAETQLVVRLVERVLGEDSLEALLLRFLALPLNRSGHPAEDRLRAAALDEHTSWRGSTIVSAWVALAAAADSAGRHVESDARLLRALRLADQLGTERALLALGSSGTGLIRSRLGRLGDLDDFARHVLRRADRLRPAERAPVAERGQNGSVLTPRERELLRELPFHQSVADIARKRNVSPNTVKTHLRNIYQKLEAANRAEAVVIAQDRGLL
jgi:LuxR family maltose regulon positive regulatory protein